LISSVKKIQEEVMAQKKEKAVVSENEVSQEDLRVAAYYRWLNEGCPDNNDLSDWLHAERELAQASN
jgi:hypothetical protein